MTTVLKTTAAEFHFAVKVQTKSNAVYSVRIPRAGDNQDPGNAEAKGYAFNKEEAETYALRQFS